MSKTSYYLDLQMRQYERSIEKKLFMDPSKRQKYFEGKREKEKIDRRVREVQNRSRVLY